VARKRAGKNANGLGSVYFDSSKDRWVVQFINEKGTLSRKFFEKKADADAHHRLTVAKREMGVKDTGHNETLQVYMERWLEQTIKPNKAASTYQSYVRTAKAHIFPTLGKIKLTELRRDMIQALIAKKATEHKKLPIKGGTARTLDTSLSHNSLRIIRAVLGSCLSDAVRDSIILHNPARIVQLPKKQRVSPSFLTGEQAKKLRAALQPTAHDTLILTMLLTGMRIGEASGLRWQDISGDGNCITVQGQLQRVGGVLTYSSTTKTHEPRVLPISPSLHAALLALKQRQREFGVEDKDGLIFIADIGARMDAAVVNKRLKQVCVQAGLPPISAHKLRHTAATLILQSSGDIGLAQKILGHKQISLTADLYSHATVEMLRGGTDALDRVTS
jgi:integrase